MTNEVPRAVKRRATLRAWAIVLAPVLALTILVEVASSNDGPKLSEAFCNDLESGATPFQIWRGVKNDYEPAKFADLAYGFAAISCPEQLRSNDGLRGYLEGWGINPDV